MFTIRKQWVIEMAHRLTMAYTKACSDCIHGHSYTIEVFLQAQELDDTGMVIDFGALGELKAVVMNLDHCLMLQTLPENQHELISNRKIMWTTFNPTAENMAKELFDVMSSLPLMIKLDKRVTLLKVRVHETASGYAEYSGE